MDRFEYDGSEPQAVATCPNCSEALRVGDEVSLLDDGDIVHDRCERKFLRTRHVEASGVMGANGEIED